MVLRKIFLTGGSGTLGTELQKISQDYSVSFIAPSSKECDVRNYDQIYEKIKTSGCEMVLHSAALVDVVGIESNPSEAWEINVVGTINIVKACQQLAKKMVFISTDYVFDGEKGCYTVKDLINPLSKYAKTKAAAELVVRTYDDSLVIRTSFFGYEFPYDGAFVDQWTSKDYVDIMAPHILQCVLTDRKGIAHVGRDRRSIYDIATDRKPGIKKMIRTDIGVSIPRDVSLC